MAKDPYRYFRVEARELLEGLSQGTIELEKGGPSTEVLGRLLRLAHTLKGAARVVKQPAIADLAHLIETRLAHHRETSEAVSADQGTALLLALDQIGKHLESLDGAPEAAVPAPRPAGTDPLETLRVDMQEMDALQRGVADAGVQAQGLRRLVGQARSLPSLAQRLSDRLVELPSTSATVTARGLAEDLRAGLEQLTRALGVEVERVGVSLEEVRDSAYRLQLVPTQTLFPALDRVVRDAANALGKRAELRLVGGEIRLDAGVVAPLRDALNHVARNAVTHGIEAEAQRRSADKPAVGQVVVSVERHGNRVRVSCQDDGRGIDLEAVRRAAVQAGRISPADAATLGADGVLALLGAGGLTTTANLSELAGRGIGLDVLQTTAAQLRGHVHIRSEPGRGTTFEIEVPVAVAAITAVVVESGAARLAIPIESVRETVRRTDAEQARSAEGISVIHEGRSIPLVPLASLLRTAPTQGQPRRAATAVVIEAEEQRLALAVDRLVGISNLVVRSLPDELQVDPVVSGASLDPEGVPWLVLDAPALVRAAQRHAAVLDGAAAPRRPVVLIVDDSLTTRMLEQSILQSAGYEVELATSAEEALAKARDAAYGLFLVDVEMPGMDGFEFVTRTRADPVLKEIPAILVTSRNAPEDRRRGQEAGARAYVVKSEFDQGQLLHTIRSLIG